MTFIYSVLCLTMVTCIGVLGLLGFPPVALLCVIIEAGEGWRMLALAHVALGALWFVLAFNEPTAVERRCVVKHFGL